MSARGRPIEPAISLERSDDGEEVKLRFLNSAGKAREVVLYRSSPPIASAAIEREMARGRTGSVAEEPHDLASCAIIESFAIQKQPDASAILTLQVKLPPRQRSFSLALPLSQQEVTALTRQLREVLPKN